MVAKPASIRRNTVGFVPFSAVPIRSERQGEFRVS
jgi:hypothetical protein